MMLSNDAMLHIYTFLPMTDVINWSKVKPHISVARVFRLRFITHLMRRCQCSRKDAIKIIANVRECDGLFSGSSVLQVLLDEFWDGSDIDIYFPANSPNYNSTMLCEILQLNKPYTVPVALYEQHNQSLTTLGEPIHSSEANFYLDYNYKWDTEHVRTYSNIQIISHTKQLGRSHHLLATENFDLSIVMNSYDGRKLEIYDFNKLKNRRSVVFRSIRGPDRIEKYTDRNIKFNPLSFPSTNLMWTDNDGVPKDKLFAQIKSFDKFQLRTTK